jgi:hypothetical protein
MQGNILLSGTFDQPPNFIKVKPLFGLAVSASPSRATEIYSEKDLALVQTFEK